MALTQRLELRQGQALVMTPQLQQAIKLLQMSNLELQAFVEGELERNPLLERDERAETESQDASEQTERSPDAAGASSDDIDGGEKLDSLHADGETRSDAPGRLSGATDSGWSSLKPSRG